MLPVTLKVLKGNPASHLYERLGFEIVAEDEIEFRMRHAPHASAKTQAK
ncbi:N-acetyltransferase [Paraburkholderia sediminicola]